MSFEKVLGLLEGTGFNGEKVQRILDTPVGWFYSSRLSFYQKTKGRVVVYVVPLLWGYTQLQLYRRGPNPGVCDMEAKHATDRAYMFRLGEEWLEKYAAGDIDEIDQNPYAINNPEGVWNKDRHLEAWWIGGK